ASLLGWPNCPPSPAVRPRSVVRVDLLLDDETRRVFADHGARIVDLAAYGYGVDVVGEHGGHFVRGHVEAQVERGAGDVATHVTRIDIGRIHDRASRGDRETCVFDERAHLGKREA